MRYTLFALLFYSLSYRVVQLDAQGDSISFSPDLPLCVGEEVIMTCFVQAPTSDNFGPNFALISINGTTAAIHSAINSNTISEVNTTRYTADTTGLTVSQSRPGARLVISNYLPSDSDTTFQCSGQYPNGTIYTPINPMSPMPEAGMPYDPVVNVPSPDCNNRTISWTAPDTDRDIKKYYIYRDGIFLANTTDNTTTNYTDRDKLDANTQHNYSVVAESCAGNSTNEIGTSFNVTVDLGKELNVTYDKNITVYVNWTLNCVTTEPFSFLTYYLELNYSHTQENNASNNSITETFSQSSDNTNYSVNITQPNIPSITNMTVVTDISVCINITKQNGMSFSGIRLCKEYSTATSSGTTTPPTSPPSTSGVIIGIVVGAVFLLFGCCILTIGILVIIFFTKKGKGYSIFSTSKQSQGNLVNDVDKDLYTQVTKSKKKVEIPMQATTKPQELLYADLDLVASHAKEVSSTIQETHYTSVKAMFDGPK